MSCKVDGIVCNSSNRIAICDSIHYLLWIIVTLESLDYEGILNFYHILNQNKLFCFFNCFKVMSNLILYIHEIMIIIFL